MLGFDALLNGRIPKEAKEEFDMKMAAQRLELERQLTELGYQAVMRESISLHVALARANPALSSSSATDSMIQKIYINSVFGAMAKHPFPVSSTTHFFVSERCDLNGRVLTFCHDRLRIFLRLHGTRTCTRRHLATASTAFSWFRRAC